MRSAKWPRKVASMLRYLSFLVQERLSLNDGKAAVFGLQKMEARGNKTLLAEAKEALAGWAKRAPPRQRRPVPEEIVSLMTVDLLDTGARPLSGTRVFSATANMLLLDTYIRPSALLGITRNNVARPATELGGAYAQSWSIVLAPQESGEITKAGEQDD